MTIAIVTDSTADLPSDVLAANHIHAVPVMLILDGKTLVDGQGISREDFYRRIGTYTHLPTTAAPPISHFMDIYERLLANGASQIISIHVASAFSGIYNIACSAAEAFKDKIHVVDSGQVTFGLGFQVLAAAQAAAQGASLEEIRALISSVSEKIRFIALLDTVEYLRRSGRVGWTAAAATNFLNLKVMIEVRKSQVLRLGLFRSHAQGVANLIQRLRDFGALEQVAILYTHLADPDEVRRIHESIRSGLINPPFIGPVTTVIGTHVGGNGIGFVAIPA